MGGDHMGGLATAITLASLCMALVPGFLCSALAYFALRKTRARWPGAVLAALVGVGAGALAVTATFYESTWAPPNTLSFDVPPRFHHQSVLVIADASAHTEVVWSGVSAPLVSRHARVAVPSSGVVRVRSIDWIYGRQIDATLSSGARCGGRSQFSDPGVGEVLAFDFAPYDRHREPNLDSLEPAERDALIREREAER